MLTPAPIMCTFVPTVFLSFFSFLFFRERWCDEGGEASWLHLGLGFLGVTCSLSSLPFPLPWIQHQPTWTWLLFLLLGNCWPRSSVHANSLKLVSNILSCCDYVVKCMWMSEKSCFCSWRIVFMKDSCKSIFLWEVLFASSHLSGSSGEL